MIPIIKAIIAIIIFKINKYQLIIIITFIILKIIRLKKSLIIKVINKKILIILRIYNIKSKNLEKNIKKVYNEKDDI